MGYRAQKIKTERKKRRLKIILLCVLVFLLLGVCIFHLFIPIREWKYRVHKPDVSKRGEGELRLHFLDVGQGDATLIELPDGKVAFIDGGRDDDKSKKNILRYLNALDIDTIDYLIVTHTDADHCGALKTVVEQKTILNAYLPATYDKEDQTYAGFYTALAKTGCLLKTSSRRVSLSINGDMPYTFAFLYPYGDESKDVSSVVWLDYMGVSTLLMGDADTQTEEILVRDDKDLHILSAYGVTLSETEILRVGHHGSSYSSSREFLDYINVETAVISCGENNAYGHPSSDVLARLETVGATVYRTDTDGHIVVTVKKDGTYKTEKCTAE